MALTIEAFRSTASSEQLVVLDRIVQLAQQERGSYRVYSALQGRIEETEREARARWGLQSEMVYAFMEFHADPLLPSRNKQAQIVDQTRAEMATLFRRAVTDLGMATLGYIQRHYEAIVGKPFPIPPAA